MHSFICSDKAARSKSKEARSISQQRGDQAPSSTMATNVDWQAKRQQAQEAARATKDWAVT